jgi:hypothetical protein
MHWLRLDLASASVTAAVLAAVALVLRLGPVRGARARWVTAAVTESGLVCGLFALWQLANRLTHTHVAGGLARGRAVWAAERFLHVPSEVALQRLILGHPWLVRAANYYYATAHLTGMLAFLVWLWLAHRDRYARWRNVLVLFTAAALLIEMVPVAPPRLIGHTGLVDTAMRYGQSVYAFVGSGVADQYAALPSIHVGWALLVAAACWSCSRTARAVGATHAVLTVLVVVATANHYWFDGLAAAALLALAVGAERGIRVLARVRESRTTRSGQVAVAVQRTELPT